MIVNLCTRFLSAPNLFRLKTRVNKIKIEKLTDIISINNKLGVSEDYTRVIYTDMWTSCIYMARKFK